MKKIVEGKRGVKEENGRERVEKERKKRKMKKQDKVEKK